MRAETARERLQNKSVEQTEEANGGELVQKYLKILYVRHHCQYPNNAIENKRKLCIKAKCMSFMMKFVSGV